MTAEEEQKLLDRVAMLERRLGLVIGGTVTLLGQLLPLLDRIPFTAALRQKIALLHDLLNAAK